MTSCWLLDEIYDQWIWDRPMNVHIPFAMLVGVCDNICDSNATTMETSETRLHGMLEEN